MRWNDFVSKAIFSLVFLVLWNVSLRSIDRYLPSISGKEKYYPKQLANNDEALNNYRLNISERLYSLTFKESDHFNPLEIRIIASDRRQNYLTQVIAFLIDSYQSKGRLPPNIEICNVEPVIFDELRRFQRHIPTRSLSKVGSKQLSLNATIAKEASDYWKCLNRTTKARYVMLLEDDALVISEFAKMTSSLVEQLDRRSHVDYVKLYHPDRLRKIPSIPVTTELYYTIQFLADLRYAATKSVYMSTTESCCTPAVIFRAKRIPEIVLQLSTKAKGGAYVGHAKDHILDESIFVGRQTDTNLVVHIGAVSSVRKRQIVLNEIVNAKN